MQDMAEELAEAVRTLEEIEARAGRLLDHVAAMRPRLERMLESVRVTYEADVAAQISALLVRLDRAEREALMLSRKG